MRTPLYLQTLKTDLAHWIAEGWVEPVAGDKILAHAKSQSPKVNLVGMFAILGAILLAFAAISFVAANWSAMGKMIRMAVMLAAMWSAYGLAAFCLHKKVMVYAHAFALLGAALFGASIMLIAQTFNIQAHYPGGVLIWGFGAFATAIIIPSRPVLIFASLLFGLWMHLSFHGPIPDSMQLWLYPALALLLMTAAIRMRSRASINVVAISLVLFAPYLAAHFEVFEEFGVALVGSTYALLALLFSWLARKKVFGAGVFSNWMALAALISGYVIQFLLEEAARYSLIANQGLPVWFLLALQAFVLLMAGFFLFLQYRAKVLSRAIAICIALGLVLLVAAPDISLVTGPLIAQMFYGGAFFVLCIALLAQGMRTDNKALIWTGGIGFVAQSLYVYFETFKDLLNTSLFFLIGGILLMALSFAALKLGKRLQLEDMK